MCVCYFTIGGEMMHTKYFIQKDLNDFYEIVRYYFVVCCGFSSCTYENHINFYKSLNGSKFPRYHFKLITSKDKREISIWSHIDYKEHSRCAKVYDPQLLEIDINLRKYITERFPNIRYRSFKERKKFIKPNNRQNE